MPARLPGARVEQALGGDWPVLVEAGGAESEGLLIEADAETVARLDFYEAVFDYHREPVAARGDTGLVPAEVWRPRQAHPGSGAGWDLEAWARRWGAMTLEAAADIMRRMGRQSADEIGRIAPIIRSRADARLRARASRRPGRIGSGLTAADVDVLSRRHPYDGFFGVEEIDLRHRRFDGGTEEVARRAIWRVTDAATVLPYDPVRDRVLLIEQVRFGPLVHGDPEPWLLEPVAGLVDAGETPEETARREAVEEAGVIVGELHFVARYYPSPGGVAQILFSYVGIADLPDEAAQLGGHVDEAEDILGHVVSFDEAMALLEGGDLVNAPAILSIQWLAANRDRLRAAAGACPG